MTPKPPALKVSRRRSYSAWMSIAYDIKNLLSYEYKGYSSRGVSLLSAHKLGHLAFSHRFPIVQHSQSRKSPQELVRLKQMQRMCRSLHRTLQISFIDQQPAGFEHLNQSREEAPLQIEEPKDYIKPLRQLPQIILLQTCPNVFDFHFPS